MYRNAPLALAGCVLATFAACDVAPNAPSQPPIGSASTTTGRDLSRISGLVLELTPGGTQPLADTRVSLITSFGNLRETNTDAAGRFEITALRSEGGQAPTAPPVTLTARRDGYSQPCRPAIDRWIGGSANDVQIHLVRNDALISGTMLHMLQSGHSVSGIVRDRRRGTPVPGARIEVLFSGGSFTFADAHTVSGFDGRFTLCGLTQPYSRYWDEGGSHFPFGQALFNAHRSGFPVYRIGLVDVRHVGELAVDID
jgi:hypothetical protein